MNHRTVNARKCYCFVPKNTTFPRATVLLGMNVIETIGS